MWKKYTLNVELILHLYCTSVAAGTHKSAGSMLHLTMKQ